MNPIVIEDRGGRQFVAALGWRRSVLASSAAKEDGLKHAKSQGASHVVFHFGVREEVRAVGYTRLPTKGKTRYFSIAAALCHQHDQHDKAIYALTLEDGGVWLCAVVDGMIVTDGDCVLEHEPADQRIAQWRERYGADARFYGDYVPGAQEFTWNDVIDACESAAQRCELTPIKSNRGIDRRSALILATCALGIAGKFGWDRYQQIQRAKLAALEDAGAVQTLSPQQAWDRAIAEWVQGSSIAKPQALTSVLNGLAETPLELGGWVLTGVQCQRGGDSWSCGARYQRNADARRTTRDFLGALPASWKADWGDVDVATGRFSVPALAERAVIAQLPPANDVSLAVLAHAQSFSRAFSKLEIGRPAGVPVKIPPQPDGRPTTVDMSQVKPQPVVMSVTFAGPLRSLHVLQAQPISWQFIKLDVSTDKLDVTGAPTQALLNVSEAKGQIYAIQK